MTGAPAQLAIAIGSVLALLGLMGLVRHLARRRGLSAELQRKLVHVGTGCYAMVLPYLFSDRWPVYFLLGLTLVVMILLRLPGVARGGIGETLHGVERRSYGDLLLALAVGVVFLISGGVPILYVLPLAVLTLSDAAAALTGTHYGTRFFPVEAGQKSVEGSITFFMVTLIVAMICLLLLSDVPRANVVLVALIVAGFATLIEADSWRGFDNFFLPAGLSVFLIAHIYSPPAELIRIMLVFCVAIWVARWVAPGLGVNRHAARVYVIAGFLLISATAPSNTVLPLMIFVAQAYASRVRPCNSAFPELDCVAAVALFSFGWLASENITHFNALVYFKLTALGMAAGFVFLTLPGAGLRRAVVAGVAIPGLILTYGWQVRGAIDGALPLSLAAMALVAAPVLARPAWFDSARALKLTLIALILPLLAWGLALWQASEVPT